LPDKSGNGEKESNGEGRASQLIDRRDGLPQCFGA
jgi:hypothetical protein